jgi:DNA-binding MurR/RpiR family transcriptional regulator
VPEAEFDRAAGLLDGAREVLGFGIGPSGYLANYLSLRLNRLGRRARSSGATGFRLIQGDSRDYVPRRKPGGAKRS